MLFIIACAGSELTPPPTYDVKAASTSLAGTLWAPYTQTAQAQPTETPSQTPIPQPTLDLYYSEMLNRIDAYQLAYNKFAVQNQKLADDPYVLKDLGWKVDTGSALAKLQIASEDLQTIPNKTSRYEKLDEIYRSLGSETLIMIKNYTTGIDKLDVTYLEKAKTNLININEFIRQATDELKVLNSNP